MYKVYYGDVITESNPIAIPSIYDDYLLEYLGFMDYVTPNFYHIAGHQNKIVFTQNGNAYVAVTRITDVEGGTSTIVDVYEMEPGGNWTLFDSISAVDPLNVKTIDLVSCRNVLFLVFDTIGLSNDITSGFYCDFNRGDISFSRINDNGIIASSGGVAGIPNIHSEEYYHGNRGFGYGIIPMVCFAKPTDANGLFSDYVLIHRERDIGTNNLRWKTLFMDLSCPESTQNAYTSSNYLGGGINAGTPCITSDKYGNVYLISCPRSCVYEAVPESSHISIGVKKIVDGIINDSSMPTFYVNEVFLSFLSKLNLNNTCQSPPSRVTMDVIYNPIEHRIHCVFAITNIITQKIEIYHIPIDLETMNDILKIGPNLNPIITFDVGWTGATPDEPTFWSTVSLGCTNTGSLILLYDRANDISASPTNLDVDIYKVIHNLYGNWDTPELLVNASELGTDYNALKPRIPNKIRDYSPLYTFDVIEQAWDGEGGIIAV